MTIPLEMNLTVIIQLQGSLLNKNCYVIYTLLDVSLLGPRPRPKPRPREEASEQAWLHLCYAPLSTEPSTPVTGRATVQSSGVGKAWSSTQ